MTKIPKRIYGPGLLCDVTREVRRLNAAFDGPGTVCLQLIDGWYTEVGHVSSGWTEIGSEDIPGDDRPCDAVAIARRLLAAFRDFRDEEGHAAG